MSQLVFRDEKNKVSVILYAVRINPETIGYYIRKFIIFSDTFDVNIKVDSGMSRFGCQSDDLNDIIKVYVCHSLLDTEVK